MSYTLGAGNGESERIEVCPHDVPLGWACVGCARDRKPTEVGTRPARPVKPPRFILRAVCDCCGSRVWLDGANPTRIARRM